MSKHKNQERDDEFLAQMDFLRSDYDNAMQTVEQQNRDIRKLISLLIEKDIPIPSDIIDRYVRHSLPNDTEELPFS